MGTGAAWDYVELHGSFFPDNDARNLYTMQAGIPETTYVTSEWGSRHTRPSPTSCSQVQLCHVTAYTCISLMTRESAAKQAITCARHACKAAIKMHDDGTVTEGRGVHQKGHALKACLQRTKQSLCTDSRCTPHVLATAATGRVVLTLFQVLYRRPPDMRHEVERNTLPAGRQTTPPTCVCVAHSTIIGTMCSSLRSPNGASSGMRERLNGH